MTPAISFTLSSSLVFAAVAYSLYCVATVLYRLHWHPLSSIPGPKLAAATQWYETYFEIIAGGGGSFTKHIKKLHDKYGP